MKKRICVVTGSRADYGILRWVMEEIRNSRHLDLITVATGSHLSKKYGYTLKEILNDGFNNLVKIDLLSDKDTSPAGISKIMSRAISKFADFFKKAKIDFLVLLGDRFEILAVAVASIPFNIPICHIGGGEICEGLIDDNIRHCLTKLSHLHFVITKECANRIKQMGEEPWRIKVVGSPRLDFIKNVKFKTKRQLKKELGINFSDKVALVIYHPVTLEPEDTQRQINNLLKAIEIINIETIIFYPNIDTNSHIIVNSIEKFSDLHPNVKLFKPLKMVDYLSLVNSIDVLIGNSSSAMIESPSFKLPAVNIGNRQKGRDHVANIINVGYEVTNIVDGIKKALYDKNFLRSVEKLKNPYGDGKVSQRIAKILCDIDLDNFRIMKKNCFY